MLAPNAKEKLSLYALPELIAENENLKNAGAILLRVIYESGIAHENVEVLEALKVFADVQPL